MIHSSAYFDYHGIMTLLYVLSGIILLGIAFLAWKMHATTLDGDPRLKAELERRNQEIGEMKNRLIELKSEKDKLSGKGVEMYDRYKTLESEYKATIKERDGLGSRLAKFEAEEDRRQKKHEEMITHQETSRKAFEDEKLRVRREDEERKKRELEERDGIWNKHEQDVQSKLRELCKKPQFAFSAYDNDNLPDGFDGSLKPDFLMEFLDQYIIFDAKVTRSQDIQTYVTNAVKTTAKKIKNNPEIYPTVFLVIPTVAIDELKQWNFVEQGFTFFVVSPESLEPILACLKKITTYELTDQFDPQERENIINWIARLDFHINARNSFDIMLAEMGAEILHDAQQLNPELAKDVEQQKERMKVPTIKPAEMKKLVSNILARQEKIGELTAPKAAIEKKSLSEA